jgi:YbbR domain-containing protein
MEITAQGFDLFAYRFRVRREPITINVKSGLQYSTLNNNSNPVIPTRSLLAHIIRQLGSDIRLVSVTPDKINLSLSDKKTKTVKVTARLALDFDKQFGLTDSIQINPNRVEVSGPAAAVEKIRGAITEKAVMKSLDKTTSKTLRLVSANGSNLTFTPAEVTVTIPVERFTEGSAEVAIETINVPLNGAVKLIPKKATVTYQVALSKYDNVSPSMFILTADLSRRQGSRVTLEIKKHPSFVKSVKVQPEKADIIITK